MSHRGPER